MTMGTSMLCGSLSLNFHTPARKSGSWGDLNALCSGRLTIQKIEGFLVANPVADSIQRSITCQTSADGVCRLICLLCQCLDLAVDFFVADFNFFFVRDLFEQQRSFDFLHSLIALSSAEAVKVHFLHVL